MLAGSLRETTNGGDDPDGDEIRGGENRGGDNHSPVFGSPRSVGGWEGGQAKLARKKSVLAAIGVNRNGLKIGQGSGRTILTGTTNGGCVSCEVAHFCLSDQRGQLIGPCGQ